MFRFISTPFVFITIPVGFSPYLPTYLHTYIHMHIHQHSHSFTPLILSFIHSFTCAYTHKSTFIHALVNFYINSHTRLLIQTTKQNTNETSISNISLTALFSPSGCGSGVSLWLANSLLINADQRPGASDSNYRYKR